MTYDEVKIETLNLRVAQSFGATLEAVADAEHRSLVNMLEVLLASYCSNSNKAPRPAARPRNLIEQQSSTSSPHEPVGSYKNTNAQPDPSETERI